MPTWLGIDIGSASVKVALVRSAYRKIALVRVASVEVAAAGGVVEAARAAAVAVLEGERAGRRRGRDGDRRLARRDPPLAPPEHAQKQLADVLAYELGAQVPFDLESAVFDWRLLDNKDAARAARRSSPRSRASTTSARASIS